MQSKQIDNPWSSIWVFLLCGLLLRLAISPFFQLAPDEANYWQWSRHPALCYHDHPPLLAWLIMLSTWLFDHNEFAVRLPTIVGVTIAFAYMGLYAARRFSSRLAFQVLLLAQGLLVFNGCALIATPDGLLLPCWAGACYHARSGLDSGRTWQWLATGFWFGLGMLTKYSMLLFLPCLLLAMLLIPDWRSRLLTPAPWLGLLLSAVLFSPVLLWNWHNDWATFRHVLYQGGYSQKAFFSGRYVGDYVLSQAALLSPLVFLLMVRSWLPGRSWQRLYRTDAVFLLCMSLPVFLVFLLLSLHTRVYGNWPAPAAISAVLLVSLVHASRSSITERTRQVWSTTVLVAYLFCLPVILQTLWPVIPVPAHLDRVSREVRGWKQLAGKVQDALHQLDSSQTPFVFGLRYQFASELAFYLLGQPETVSINRWTRPNVYDFWNQEEKLLDRDAVGVIEWEGSKEQLLEVFTRIDPPEPFTVWRNSPWFGKEPVATYYVVRAYGFKGGLAWQARDAGDIRAPGLPRR